MIRAIARRLRRDSEGATIVEFALIAPVLLMMLMGLLDLAYNMYTAQMLQGAIQTAARKSTIEGAANGSAALDGIVTTAVHTIAPAATMTFSRKSYASFTAVGRPEDFTDADNDGTCNNGEVFEDANNNGVWDVDPGAAGQGSARDAVLYTVTVNFQRAFPVFAFIPGQSSDYTMKASTVLRNQPYGTQAGGGVPTTGNCT